MRVAARCVTKGGKGRPRSTLRSGDGVLGCALCIVRVAIVHLYMCAVWGLSRKRQMIGHRDAVLAGPAGRTPQSPPLRRETPHWVRSVSALAAHDSVEVEPRILLWGYSLYILCGGV